MIHILKNANETYHYRYKGWEEQVMVQVRAVLKVLDDEYGKDRNLHKDLGGFVLLCDSDTTADEVRETINLPYEEEWADEIETYDETYVMALYLLGSDYSVVTVTTKALFDELQNPEWTI